MMNLIDRYDAAVAAYMHDLEAVGTSKRTQDNYRLRLKYFRAFLVENAGENADYITCTMLKAWRDQMLAAGKKPSTVRQYMIELRAFFAACLDDDAGYPEIVSRERGSNPVTDRALPKNKEARQEYSDEKALDAADMARLFRNDFSGLDGRPRHFWARNYAIIVLLLDSKIRNAELLDLRLSDVDFENHELRVRKGKGEKCRYVTLRDISLSAIRLYLASGLRPAYLTEDDYLFGTQFEDHTYGIGCKRNADVWDRGSRDWLSRLVERHVEKVTGKSGFRSHSLRHAGSVLDLNSGQHLERIQAELGHASITTTELYAERLKSCRKAMEYAEVAKARDMWAKRNMEMLKC